MSRIITRVLGIFCVVSIGASISTGSAQPPKSLHDGLFSEAQVERGAEAYNARCASCHAADLRGNSNSPGLLGMSFMFLWEGRSVGDLYTQMSSNMPSDQPGSLPTQTYLDILAYILHANQFPVGAEELVADADWLDSVLIIP